MKQMIQGNRVNNYTITNSEQALRFSVARTALYEKFKTKIIPNPCLNRRLISFQANKETPFYSWFKYKEGFSERLVTYLLQNFKRQAGILLDPFAGCGAALFAASSLGWKNIGIELLPVGIYAIQSRILANKINVKEFKLVVAEIIDINFADYYDPSYQIKHIAITRGAFSSVVPKM
jgi:DNA modification methylase